MICFRCSHCDAKINVPAGSEGKKSRCPGCRGVTVVPTARSTNAETGLRPAEKHSTFADAPSNDPTPSRPSKRGGLLAWIIQAGLAFGVLWYFGWFGGESKTTIDSKKANQPVEQKIDKVGAWTMAQVFVEKNLKSPGSASYGSVFGGDYQDPDKCVTFNKATGVYSIHGWVDSQNSFGALLRSDFIVSVKDAGDGEWVLVSGPVIVTR